MSQKIIDISKLTRRKYLAEVLEVGINELRGYYKVKLLDYEDPSTPILWVKDNMNKYISDTHGQYLPILPGDKVIIEFTDNTITSGMITQIHTPKKISDKLNKMDNEQLTNVNRYTIVKTDKNSSCIFDEQQNYALFDFQEGTGTIKIDKSEMSITHSNNINIGASNECKINSGNHVGIYSQKIDLDFGQFQKSANSNDIDYKTFSKQIKSFDKLADIINKAIKHSINRFKQDTHTTFELLEALSNNTSKNSIVYVSVNKEKNQYNVYIQSIETFKNKIKQILLNELHKSNIDKLVNKISENYTKNKELIRNEISVKLLSLDEKLNQLQELLQKASINNSELKNSLQSLKNFTSRLREQIYAI